jgi:hypothetical protein
MGTVCDACRAATRLPDAIARMTSMLAASSLAYFVNKHRSGTPTQMTAML